MDIHEIRKTNLVTLIGGRRKGACADKWEMAAAHLSQVLSNKTAKNLGEDVARRIEQKEGLPHGWLDRLQSPTSERIGSYAVDQKPGVGESNVESGPDVKGLLPLISWVQAGSWHEVSDPYAVGDAEDWIACPVGHGPRTFVLRVRGESMFNPHARKSFRPGDLIFVDPERDAENGSMVVVKLDDSQEATFKQLVIEDGYRYLKAINPAWPEPIIRVDKDATICGVVIGRFDPM